MRRKDCTNSCFFLLVMPRTRREFALPEAWISVFGSVCKGKKRGGVAELFCLISLKNGMRGDGDSKKSSGEKEQERKALFAFGKERWKVLIIRCLQNGFPSLSFWLAFS